MKFFLKNQGVITAFVTMIMVPVVVITGIFVDMSRFKFCSSQAVMAADAYAEGILGTYDNVLKELYGLFSVSQSEEGKQAIEEIAEYVGCSFDPSGKDTFKIDMGHNFSIGTVELEGSMPYSSVDVKLEYQPIEGATLKNSSIFLTQVGDFMQYRIIGDLIDSLANPSILDAFESVKEIGSDSEAMDTVNKIGENSSKALGEIEEYYNNLKKIAEYPDYKLGLEKKYKDYSDELQNIVNSDLYEAYHNYIENKEEIDEAVYYRDHTVPQERANAEANGESYSPNEDLINLASEYRDVNDCKRQIQELVDEVQTEAKNYKIDNITINFDNTNGFINALDRHTTEIENSVASIEDNLEELYGTSDMENLEITEGGQLSKCSDRVKNGIDLDIKGNGNERDPSLQKIAELKGHFYKTYENIEIRNKNSDKNNSNKEYYKNAIDDLDNCLNSIKQANIIPNTALNKKINPPLSWYDFENDTGEFYKRLQEICEAPENSEVKDKNAAEEKKEKAKDEEEKAKKLIDDDEKELDEKKIRNIENEIAQQLNGSSDGEGPELGLIGISSFTGLPSMVLDKFLLASYNFGMFSSRVTGIEAKEETLDMDSLEDNTEDITEELTEEVTEELTEDSEEENSSEKEYADYTLTNIKMSRDINYLYGAELEYLFGGNKNSVKNLNAVRNTICGVRMAFNYASTYSITSVNAAIQNAATAAASAVAATGVGAAAIPLIRMSVSAALRMAVASAETAQEWLQFKEREKVLLYKNKANDLQIYETLTDIIGETVSEVDDVTESLEIKLSYEDYLYLLMMLFVNTETLTSRTADLITLNVNHSQNEDDELTTLEFNMANTVTAIESTCKVKMNFTVVPDNFADMFLSGTTTETTIKSLEDRYTGFSLIRGY